MLASQISHVKNVEQLIRPKDIDVKAATETDLIALKLACYNGQVEYGERLIRIIDIDINSKTNDDFTAFMLGFKDGHVKRAEILF